MQVPVLREGNVLILPNYSLEVVEACSGVRSLMSLITLAVAYGYFVESQRWVRYTLPILMVPIAIISNAFRIMGTGALTYHFSGRRPPKGFSTVFWVDDSCGRASSHVCLPLDFETNWQRSAADS